jgi:hypothetical protein
MVHTPSWQHPFPGGPLMAVLSYQSRSKSLVLRVLLSVRVYLSCSACPFLSIIFCLSCSRCRALASHSGYPVLPVPLCMSSSAYPALCLVLNVCSTCPVLDSCGLGYPANSSNSGSMTVMKLHTHFHV